MARKKRRKKVYDEAQAEGVVRLALNQAVSFNFVLLLLKERLSFEEAS